MNEEILDVTKINAENEENNPFSESLQLQTEEVLSSDFEIIDYTEQLNEIILNQSIFIDNQLKLNQLIIEGIWIVFVALAVAVGLKIFWDHILRW